MPSGIWPPIPAADGPYLPKDLPEGATNEFWIDSNLSGLSTGIGYALYPQPARGPTALGSFLYRLPPSYESTRDKRFPILVWLHGGLSNSRHAEWAIQFYGRKMEEGLMPEAVIVAPQILPQGRYVDSYDGKRPLATITARDLIQAIESQFRTIQHKSARWIEGFSMGGLGAFHVPFAHPDVFGAASAFSGAFLWRIEDENDYAVRDPYGGKHNRKLYDDTHPYYLAERNKDSLGRVLCRVVEGEADVRLFEGNKRMAKRLQELGFECDFLTVPDVGHLYPELVAGIGDRAWTFWQEASKRIVEQGESL